MPVLVWGTSSPPLLIDTCENITSRRTSYVGGSKNSQYVSQDSSEYCPIQIMKGPVTYKTTQMTCAFKFDDTHLLYFKKKSRNRGRVKFYHIIILFALCNLFCYTVVPNRKGLFRAPKLKISLFTYNHIHSQADLSNSDQLVISAMVQCRLVDFPFLIPIKLIQM